MTDRHCDLRAGPPDYHTALLDVSLRSEGPSGWVVEVRGELDLFTGPMVKQHLESYNDSGGNHGHPQRITYLLPGLEFMDVGGLNALLTAVDGHGPETITIREPSSSVRRLLQLVGLDSMIEERVNR